MNVYVLSQHWNGESYGNWQSTILGVYSSKEDAESLMHKEMDKIDQQYAREYQFTVQELTINQPIQPTH